MRKIEEILNQIKKYDDNNVADGALTIGKTDVEVLDSVQAELTWFNIVTKTDCTIEGESVSAEVTLCGDAYMVFVTEYAPIEFASCESSDIDYLVKFVRV